MDKRDPDPYSQENEFRQEFYQRIEEANRFFRSEGIPGWKTDRGRIYIFLGQPDKIDNPFVRQFTQAALAAPIPIILGGHSLVSGGLLALIEIGGQKVSC